MHAYKDAGGWWLVDSVEKLPAMGADMRNMRSMDFATLSVGVRRLAQLATAHTRIA